MEGAKALPRIRKDITLPVMAPKWFLPKKVATVMTSNIGGLILPSHGILKKQYSIDKIQRKSHGRVQIVSGDSSLNPVSEENLINPKIQHPTPKIAFPIL